MEKMKLSPLPWKVDADRYRQNGLYGIVDARGCLITEVSYYEQACFIARACSHFEGMLMIINGIMGNPDVCDAKLQIKAGAFLQKLEDAK